MTSRGPGDGDRSETEPLEAEIDRAKGDENSVQTLRAVVERDNDILDRLAD